MQLVDSHAHLDHLDDLDSALERAQKAGVTKIVTIGTTIAESQNAANLALSCSRLQPERHSARGPGLDRRTTGLEVYATAGIHPKDGKKEVEKFGLLQCIKTLKQIAESSKKVVAIGECGLDYDEQETGNNKQKNGEDEKESQRVLFKAQIELAAELKLPIVIHCRNGWTEIFDILKTSTKYSSSRKREVSLRTNNSSSGKFSPPSGGSNNNLRGVFHSWTGDWKAAKRALDLGFYISFSGIVTFKNAPEIQEVAKKAPLDRILVETDSPFLAPEPLRSAQGKLGRGKTNEPKNVKIVAQFIAKLRNLPSDKIASATSVNAQELFGLN